MTCIEKLSLAQTVIGFVTFVALVWYAWETREIRLDAAHQNELLRDQVELTRKMLNFELSKEASAHEPEFLWQGSGSGPGLDTCRCSFKNNGAAVQQVRAEAENGAKLEITASLDSGATGNIELKPSPRAEPVRFKIHYMTNRGQKSTRFFSLRSGQNPVEIPPF